MATVLNLSASNQLNLLNYLSGNAITPAKTNALILECQNLNLVRSRRVLYRTLRVDKPLSKISLTSLNKKLISCSESQYHSLYAAECVCSDAKYYYVLKLIAQPLLAYDDLKTLIKTVSSNDLSRTCFELETLALYTPEVMETAEVISIYNNEDCRKFAKIFYNATSPYIKDDS